MFDKNKEHSPKDASETEKWKMRAEENLNGWKRAKADYLNLKKEADKQIESMATFANAAMIIAILPIADHFRLALAHIPESDRAQEWVKGIVNIKKELDELFKVLELREVETHTFTPHLHEAISKEYREGVKPDTILEVVEPGYTLHGKLLRPAKVKVAIEKTHEEKER